MVNYSYSIYYNAISLLIKESLYLPLFAKYAPALGTQKRPPRAVFFGAQMGPSTPRRFAAAPEGVKCTPKVGRLIMFLFAMSSILYRTHSV